jgi:hypothetical protein
MSAILYSFEAERLRRRPYADLSVSSLFTMFDCAFQRGQVAVMELVNHELEYRSQRGVDIRRAR